MVVLWSVNVPLKSWFSYVKFVALLHACWLFILVAGSYYIHLVTITMTYLDTWYIATGFMIFCAGYHVNEVSVDLAVTTG